MYLLDTLTMGMCLVKLLNTLTLVVCLVYLLDTLWECVRCNFWTLFESSVRYVDTMGVCLARLLDTLWECVWHDFRTLHGSVLVETFGHYGSVW